MERKLYLHIGQPKTGSTSIQRSLIKNRVELHSQGVAQLVDFEKNMEKRLACYCFSEGKFNRERVNNGITNKSQLDVFKSQVEKDLDDEIFSNDSEDWIISSEALTELETPEEKMNLKKILSNYFSRIIIICYFRNQSDHLISGYSQEVKSGRFEEVDVKEALKRRKGKYNYYEFSLAWIEIFNSENFIPKLFHKNNFTGGSLLIDFFSICNVSIESMDLHNEDNVSLSRSGTFLLIYINKLLKSKSVNLVGHERDRLIDEVLKATKKDKYELDADSIDTIMSHVKHTNEQFINKFFNDTEFNPLLIKNIYSEKI